MKSSLIYLFALFLPPVFVVGQPIRFAMGSCADLSDPRRESIFDQITKVKPDFFLWLGDNTYYERGEWNDSILMVANWSRRHASEPLARMMKVIPQRAIWDDHDFGPNDADSTYPLRHTSARIFQSTFVDTPFDFARYGDLRWSERRGHALFIALDDRMHRGPVGTQVLGQGQLDYVSSLLKQHRDAEVVFIAVGSQVLNTAEVFENLIRYPKERTELLNRCSKFPGQVVFLTGDRHHGEVEEYIHKGKIFIEVCSSPLTSRVYAPRSPEVETNKTIVGQPVTQEHFTLITVDKKEFSIDYFSTIGETIVNVKYEL